MAIKIDNKDLQRRIINGQDVQKVILNWSQIWPTEVPYVDYHVISDFTGGWGWWWGWGGWGLPWWWTFTWGSQWWLRIVPNEWIKIDQDAPTGTVGKVRYTWMPSLANAKRIVVEINFDLIQRASLGTETINTPLYGFLEPGDSWIWLRHKQDDSAEIASYYNYGWFASRWTVQLTQWDSYKMVWDISKRSASRWIYWAGDLYLCDSSGTRITPSSGSYWMTTWEIVATSTSFEVWLLEGITVSKVDFYIYNN